MSPHDFISRRSFVRSCAAAAAAAAAFESTLGAGRLYALVEQDPEHPAVPNDAVAAAIREIAGGHPIRRGHVELDMPAVAEDGRVVPVFIESDLPMTRDRYVKSVHLIVDHNPDVHLAAFELTPALGAVSISTRIKMKRTTWVRALMRTNTGEVWANYAKVRVTLNGCG